MKRWSLLLFILTKVYFSQGQFSLTNLLEYQYGNLPSDTVGAFSTLYDRLLIDYSLNKWKAGVTFEQFSSPFENRSYYRLNQVRVQYFGKDLEVQLGNFYETLGRGTLLRSYQIPGGVLEDLTFRSRYFFNQDMLGGLVKYTIKNFTLKAVYGSPLNAVLPPNQEFEDRRADQVAAADLGYAFENHSVGAAFMNIKDEFDRFSIVKIRGSGNLSPTLSYYTELAKNLDSQYEFTSFSAGSSSYAWYFNLNYYAENFGITTELKSYEDFLLGVGINQPPALVTQHIYRQLNRSTHVMNPTNESGYQIEAYYNFPAPSEDEPSNTILTLNHTLAINDFGRRFVFREYFVEFASSLGNQDYKVFFDYAEDPFKGQSSRISTGTYIDWKLSKKSGLSTEYEFQRFDRFGNSFQNQLVGITYNYKSVFSGGVLAEYSDDDFLLDESQTGRFWLGANFKYKPGFKNTFLLFLGSRRGGPACNSGICYEILDFQGMEVRWTTRL